jgi:hypothetical protein
MSQREEPPDFQKTQFALFAVAQAADVREVCENMAATTLTPGDPHYRLWNTAR